MSTAAAQSPVLDHLDFVRVWAKSLAELLSQTSDAPVACEVLPRIPENAGARGEHDLWVIATLTGTLLGELSFRLTPADARQFVQKYEAKADNSDTTIREDAVLDLLRKAAATVSAQLKTAGTDVQVQLAFGPGSSLGSSRNVLCPGRPGNTGFRGSGLE